jgi:two-component system, NarL family, response regulator NreC
MDRKKLLIVDDHSIVREGLRALLSAIPGFEVVGEAENGQIAVEHTRNLKPDVILMDLSMPVMNGTEATRAIKQRHPDVKVIALTANKSHDHVLATLAAGANGYILKDDTSHSLLSAIENIITGKSYLSPGVCNTVLNRFLDSSDSLDSERSWAKLTSREREVIKLVAEGYKNREIANYLSLSIKTVEKHRSNLMNKLDIHCVSALTLYAIEHSLVSI